VSQRLRDDDDDVFASQRSPFASASAFLSSSSSSSSRLVIVAPGATASGIACFVQTTAVAPDNERRTLVLVVPTFNLESDESIQEFFTGNVPWSNGRSKNMTCSHRENSFVQSSLVLTAKNTPHANFARSSEILNIIDTYCFSRPHHVSHWPRTYFLTSQLRV
jgi:hypothetical protein